MITVIREWAEHIQKVKDKFTDFNQLITESYKSAMQSLAETPAKLEVLAKAKVVDAGAKGFVVFLEGMIDFFKHGEVKRILGVRNVTKIQPVEAMHDHENINFRYCTEAMIVGDNIIREKLRSKIEHLGDSLVIAGLGKENAYPHSHRYPRHTFYKTDQLLEASLRKRWMTW
jgi:uncharacterized protein